MKSTLVIKDYEDRGPPIADEWHIQQRGTTAHLCGIVRNDVRAKDGSHIVTSGIVGRRDGQVLTRTGSRYILGTPSPNARFHNVPPESYLASLPELP